MRVGKYIAMSFSLSQSKLCGRGGEGRFALSEIFAPPNITQFQTLSEVESANRWGVGGGGQIK